jgi:hypothetical protein
MAEGDPGLEGLEGLGEALDRLYGGPPGEFTAERDRLAKALRKDGEKERAAAVGRLRRPTRLAAALNAIARADPEGLGRLIDASTALAEAQEDVLKGRGDAAGLRDAERAEREALEPLVAGAGEDGPALAAALRTGARSPGGREPLRRGWLSREPEPDAGALFAVGAPPPRQSARREPEAAARQSAGAETETPTRRLELVTAPDPVQPQAAEAEAAPDPATPARLERAKAALDAARAAAEEAEAEHAGAEADARAAAGAHRAANDARDDARAAAGESARRAAEDAERAAAAAREAEGAGERAEAEEARARAAAERRDAARRALEEAETAAREAIAAAERRA